MFKFAFALLLPVGLVACDDRPSEPEGLHHGYVVSAINLPTTSMEARTIGLDIDGDGRLDNQLGSVVAALGMFGNYNFDAETNALVQSGAILHLIDVQATGLDQAENVGLTVLHGIDSDGDASDNFNGLESFQRDPSRGEGLTTGAITEYHLETECGTAPIAVTLPGLDGAVVLPLVGARFDAWTTVDGQLEGKFGGGIPREHVQNTLLPLVHDGLSRAIARDCPDGVCVPESWGAELLVAFDANDDGTMTLDELRGNSLVQSLFSPDLDLYDRDRGYAGCGDEDGDDDALSIGAGFHAVRATF